jgi:A/G-specific adenine glycosylase
MSTTFAQRLVRWQKQHGRHDLPWQHTRDAYRVWLSEIMLQQTQVATVLGYYQRFLQRFPDIRALAAAHEDEVLQLWSGLGYYSRARNLHRAAQIVVGQFGGEFPREFDALLALPGVGRSTAAAISAFAFGRRRAILDGNVKRVLCRHLGVAGFPGDKAVETLLWQRAESLLPRRGVEVYTQALMDLGAGVCVRSQPRCGACPVSADCVAYQQDRIGELPAPRPKKNYPEKSTVMLIALDRGAVLLEKRPPVGIWGGLWSFPEIASAEDAVQVCRTRFGIEARKLPAWPVLQHGFTHFRLQITPQPLQVVRRDSRVEQPGRLWLAVADAVGAAIPQPVRVLLRQLGEGAAAAIEPPRGYDS